jgi:hypothetical protein
VRTINLASILALDSKMTWYKIMWLAFKGEIGLQTYPPECSCCTPWVEQSGNQPHDDQQPRKDGRFQ